MITTVTTHVRPGMANEYIDLKKEQVAAFKKAGRTAYGVHRLMWGGARSTFVSCGRLDKMAELDGPSPMASSMSEDERAKWFERILPLLAESSERNVWVYEPNLSYQSEQ